MSILCEATNWKPKKMIKLTELLQKQYLSRLIAKKFKKNKNHQIGVDSTLSQYIDNSDSSDEDMKKTPPTYEGKEWR